MSDEIYLSLKAPLRYYLTQWSYPANSASRSSHHTNPRLIRLATRRTAPTRTYPSPYITVYTTSAGRLIPLPYLLHVILNLLTNA